MFREETNLPQINLETPVKEFRVICKNTLTTKHEIVIPFNVSYDEFKEQDTFQAKEYPFTLDDFQKLSLTALERDESVLVAAHTSSGKTVIAEYAIALSLKKKQRVIYTSPIKALSNQKYRELQAEFEDVGLMTGDITLNPQATCLVMTTEILRNMLYKGSEVLREIHFVIFDEIHYMRDRERGVVWEETIILLPDHVKMVFLSATIPNALEFTSWVAKTHNQIVHVIYTEKRVTPLTHIIYPKGSKRFFKVKYFDNRKNKDLFDSSTYLKGLKKLNSRGRIDEIDMKDVIENLIAEDSLPTIIFSFSRKECEKYAICIDRDFLNEEEKEKIKFIFKQALSVLREEDRNLPLIKNLLPLLLKGIGIHHSGLLPILKEIVEILFQEGLLRLLFATETFSIGLNMPARSVVFTSIRKFDGDERRIISPGEYIQMSGRAGRRGIDPRGIVIMMLSEEISEKEGYNMLSGAPDKLNSAFYLSYNMILNLTRVEGLDPLYLLSRSFFHYQKINERTQLSKSLAIFYDKIPRRPKQDSYIYQLYLKRNEFKIKRNEDLCNFFMKHLSRGSIVDIFYVKHNIPYTITKCFVSSIINDKIDVIYILYGEITKNTFPIKSIENVYSGKVKLEFRNFFKKYNLMSVKSKFDRQILDIENEIKNFKLYIPFETCLLCELPTRFCVKKCEYINYIDQLIKNNFVNCICCDTKAPIIYNGEERFDLEGRSLTDFDTKNHKYFEAHEFGLIEQFRVEKLRQVYQEKVLEFQGLINIFHMKQCEKMLKVLRTLEYCDDKSILPKGKFACEISSGHELILSEMVFNGDFLNMKLESLISLLSCFVFEEWQSDEIFLTEESEKIYKILKRRVLNIVDVLNGAEIRVDQVVFLKQFSYEMMDVVKLWIKGATFGTLIDSTSIFEGSIVRCFRRLEELLRQLVVAARIIGNTELENSFEEGILKIKRDIVFAGSLYL